MLIGIDASRALRARRTGTERYSLEIIRHLLRLPEAAAHNWRLYADADVDPALFQTGGDVQVEMCVLPARRMWTHRALGPEVLHRPPDALFIPAHVLPFTLPPGRLPPSVVTVHDLGYRHFPQAHTRSQRWYLEASTRWNAANATRVIAISQATARDLQTAYGTPAAKISVIHEAAEGWARATDAAQQTAREKYGLARPYALFTGSIQPRKNLERLLDAYARLHAAEPLSWDLALVGGRGWLSDPLYEQTQTLELEERIHFTGYVPDKDLIALLSGARFFAFPSLFEGFGLPVLEAQSVGVPVMTANNSSLPEIAGDAALLVDPTDVDAMADAMLRLSQDEALRQRLIEAGYENVKRFSWTKAAEETLAVLEEVAQTQQPDRAEDE
jgi:glycosyltransferase involved in cell wall biosynthesis